MEEKTSYVSNYLFLALGKEMSDPLKIIRLPMCLYSLYGGVEPYRVL